MVLKQPGQLLLKLPVRAEMITHWPRVPVPEAIVKSLVIGIVEALPLKYPSEVPINLGDKEEVRPARAD
jgi:hypothetical protein